MTFNWRLLSIDYQLLLIEYPLLNRDYLILSFLFRFGSPKCENVHQSKTTIDSWLMSFNWRLLVSTVDYKILSISYTDYRLTINYRISNIDFSISIRLLITHKWLEIIKRAVNWRLLSIDSWLWSIDYQLYWISTITYRLSTIEY